MEIKRAQLERARQSELEIKHLSLELIKRQERNKERTRQREVEMKPVDVELPQRQERREERPRLLREFESKSVDFELPRHQERREERTRQSCTEGLILEDMVTAVEYRQSHPMVPGKRVPGFAVPSREPPPDFSRREPNPFPSRSLSLVPHNIGNCDSFEREEIVPHPEEYQQDRGAYQSNLNMVNGLLDDIATAVSGMGRDSHNYHLQNGHNGDLR